MAGFFFNAREDYSVTASQKKNNDLRSFESPPWVPSLKTVEWNKKNGALRKAMFFLIPRYGSYLFMGMLS